MTATSDHGGSVLDGVAALVTAVREDGCGPAVFAAADGAAQDIIGHRLFTVMAYHPGSIQVERLYSSNPSAYPVGGRKDKKDTAWGRRVLDAGEPFLGTGPDDIRAHFDDYERILGLGLGSILNMPVVHGGRVLGTMNLTHEAGHYGEAHLAPARLLAALLVPVMVDGGKRQ
jgi:hypothetical protein